MSHQWLLQLDQILRAQITNMALQCGLLRTCGTHVLYLRAQCRHVCLRRLHNGSNRTLVLSHGGGHTTQTEERSPGPQPWPHRNRTQQWLLSAAPSAPAQCPCGGTPDISRGNKQPGKVCHAPLSRVYGVAVSAALITLYQSPFNSMHFCASCSAWSRSLTAAYAADRLLHPVRAIVVSKKCRAGDSEGRYRSRTNTAFRTIKKMPKQHVTRHDSI
jgi:hypothetical protein